MLRLTVFAFMFIAAFGAAADEKRFTLSADPALSETGLLAFILPRFSLKTGVKVGIGPGGEVAIGAAADGPAVFRAVAEGQAFRLSLAPGAGPGAARFADWLKSEIGLRAVESFAPEGAALFARVEAAPAPEAAAENTGDVALGETLSLRHCGRCHVVNEKNKFGGIGSTPSFGAMKNLPRWRDRFETFWTLNPHPSFTQVEDMTEPFDPTRPPPIAPLELTLADVGAIVAYVVSMPRKDLGGALVAQ